MRVAVAVPAAVPALVTRTAAMASARTVRASAPTREPSLEARHLRSSPDPAPAILHGRVMAVLGHPLVAWSQFAALMWTIHFSGLFQLATENPLVHAIEHVLFLGSAALFRWPARGSRTDDSASAIRFDSCTWRWRCRRTRSSACLTSAGGVLYPHYRSRADQRQAGGGMWVAGDIVLLVVVVLLTVAWARQEEVTTRRRERIEDDRERMRGRSRSAAE